MAKKSHGLFTLAVGAIAGAAAVFFSKEENRQKAQVAVEEATLEAKKTVKKTKSAVKKQVASVKKTAKKTQKAAVKARKTVKKIASKK